MKGGICKACLESIPTVVHGCRRCGAEQPGIIGAESNSLTKSNPEPITLTTGNDATTKSNPEPMALATGDDATIVGPIAPEASAYGSRSQKKSEGCFHCRQGKWPARRTYAFGTYGGTLAKVLVLLKRPGSESSAIALGSAMAEWLKRQSAPETSNQLTAEPSFDAIVSTPKYWMRRVSQRHNASELLAEAIGIRLGVPVWTDAVFQTRPTSKQGLLLASQRRQNVQGAFAVNTARSLQGKRILIVDDIVTSGSTMAEISSVLKRARVASVDGFCAARGVGTGGK